MRFHDDIDKAFKPLYDHVKGNEEVLSQYMYMYHDEDDTHYYKHFGNRKYISLDQSGELLDGKVEDPGDWE